MKCISKLLRIGKQLLASDVIASRSKQLCLTVQLTDFVVLKKFQNIGFHLMGRSNRFLKMPGLFHPSAYPSIIMSEEVPCELFLVWQLYTRLRLRLCFNVKRFSNTTI